MGEKLAIVNAHLLPRKFVYPAVVTPDSGVRHKMSLSDAFVLVGANRPRHSPFALGLEETAGSIKSTADVPKAAAQPGARAKLSETIVLEAEKKTPESALATAKVFLRSATIGNDPAGTQTVWVPARTLLAARNLGEFLPLSAETRNLLDQYRRSGVQALLQLK